MLSMLFCPASFPATFDEAYNLAVTNNYLIKKSNYDGQYYLELQKTFNKYVNFSYDLKNLLESGQPKIDYILTDKIDFLNFNKLKSDAYSFYYRANNAQIIIQKRAILNDVGDTYFNFLLNKIQYQSSLENVKWAELMLKNTRILEKAGKISFVDTVVARTALNEAIAKSNTYLSQLKVFKYRLKELTGRELNPEIPVVPSLQTENYYFNKYSKNDPNTRYYDLTNRALRLEAEYEEKTSFFSPALYGEVQTSNDSTTNIKSATLSFGLEFTGTYNPNLPFQRLAREKQLLSNNAQANQSLRESQLLINKLYQETLAFRENSKLLEENQKLTKDVIRRMEEGYKVRYINLLDLLKVRNDHLNNLYSLNEARINLIKNIVLLEKLVSRELYVD